MDKIGFKNFRNFEELPSIDLGGITVLLGGNNTGKSSLVKGALLMHDFIQTKNVKDEDTMTPFFMFNSGLVNIGSFFRAICRNKSNNGRTISFYHAGRVVSINYLLVSFWSDVIYVYCPFFPCTSSRNRFNALLSLCTIFSISRCRDSCSPRFNCVSQRAF